MPVRPVKIDDVLQDMANKARRAQSRHPEFGPAQPAGDRIPAPSLSPIRSVAAAGAVAVIRLALKLRMEGTALRLARIGAKLNDRNALLRWELAKLLLRFEHRLPSLGPGRMRTELLWALKGANSSNASRIRAAAEPLYAEALYRNGCYDEALAITEAALVRGDIRVERTRANALVATRRFADGHALYAELLARDPANAELRRRSELLAPLARISALNDGPTVRPDGSSLLIGVGSGIGDLLHTTPMIRNIAQRTGKRVDVLVLGDHVGLEFLADRSECVNRVWLPSADVLAARYDTVFLTHSFRQLRFPFNAERICASQDWRRFRPGDMHETLFNLEAATRLLGIAYDESDATTYFAGNLKYDPPAQVLVGIHAGSKHGRWLSKRWPYFAELALRLITRGIRVASFGIAEEYVPGTEDRTGGTIEEMSRSMLDCTLFISNDSGPMHIASALGIPVLAMFAPTDPMTHLPLRATTQALALQKNCAPCEVKDHTFFASGRCSCIAEISVREVEKKLMDMMTDALGRPFVADGEMRGSVP